ncbi:MAG: hypothetical protein GY850_35285 [bacterium]|nr:hypothetical protein [bacterium]
MPIEQVLTITNAGGGPLAVTGASTDNAVFEVTAILGESLPFIINPGEARNLSVRFAPPTGSAGTSYTGTLTVASDDPDEGTRSVSLSGSAVPDTMPPDISPVLDARVQIEPDVFDLINADTCSDVGGQVQFGAESAGVDSFYVTLADQGGVAASSAINQAIDGPGSAAFSGIDACSLTDGIIDIEVLYTRNGAEVAPFAGTPAVKYTGTLEPPVLDPVPPFSFSPAIQVCGTSRVNTTVRIEGGASIDDP